MPRFNVSSMRGRFGLGPSSCGWGQWSAPTRHRCRYIAPPRALRLEILETRALLSVQAVTLADSSYWGASGAGASLAPSLFSSDGQEIAFQSTAGNLVANDFNGVDDIFVRNLTTGTTMLASVATDGNAGNGRSRNPHLSADGRFVMFTSDASNLVQGDTTGGRNVFVRDLQLGITTLVSVNAAGSGPGNSPSDGVAISADGRYALFTSTAHNLVSQTTPGNTNVYLRDLVTQTTALVDINVIGTAGGNNGAGSGFGDNLTPLGVSMTPDGRYVVFQSDSSDLVANDGNTRTDVFVRDMQLGTTTLASINAQETSPGNFESFQPAISPDGRYVTFTSLATDLVSGTPGGQNVFVRDLQLGTTKLVSVDNIFDNSSVPQAHDPVISSDGRFVLYQGDLGGSITELYLRDTVADTTTLVNANNSSGVHLADGKTFAGVFSPDERTIYFASTATNLVSENSGGFSQIYARNLTTGTTRLISRAPSATAGAGDSKLPLLSSDGTQLVFASLAGDLVAQDNNRLQDLFLLNVSTGATTLVSAVVPALQNAFTALNSPFGLGGIRTQTLSADGRYDFFISLARPDLVPIPTSRSNIYRRDLQTGATELVTLSADGTVGDGGDLSLFPQLRPAVSADGRYVAFTSNSTALVPGLTFEPGMWGVFLRDMTTGTTRVVSVDPAGKITGDPAAALTMSTDGRYLAFTSSQSLLAGTTGNDNLYLFDAQTGQLFLVARTPSGGSPNGTSRVNGPLLEGDSATVHSFSADDRFLVFDSKATDLVAGGAPAGGVYVRDLQTGLITLVSVAANGQAATGTDESISADGQRVLFLTKDSLVPQDTNGALGDSGDVYVRDLAAGSTTLVSFNEAGTAALGASSDAAFSANGQFAAFVSFGEVSASDPYNHIYSRDLQNGITQVVDVNQAGNHNASGTSYTPAISDDGRFVSFSSEAADLTPEAVPSLPNVFLRDMVAKTTTLVDLNKSGTAAGNQGAFDSQISGDGSVVVFTSDSTDLVPNDINGATDFFAFNQSAAGQASISGQVFLDANGNRAKDSSEPGLAGWTVFLDTIANGTLDPGEPNVMTDPTGNYTFSGLSPGTYTVAEVLQGGFRETLPDAPGTYSVTVAASEQISGKDFGNQPLLPDLTVQSNLVLPASGTSGRNVTVQWTVANGGAADALGGWQDALFLSPHNTLDSSAVLLDLVAHTGGLAQGQTYTQSDSVAIPGLLPGNYFLIVQTDRRNQVPEIVETNNVIASAAPIALAIPTLSLGTPVSDTFSAPGDERYYQIQAPAGQTLNVVLDSAALGGDTALYVSLNTLPTPGAFDFRAQTFQPDETLSIPSTTAGTYYILAQGQSGDAATSGFTLTASLPGFSIGAVSPNQGGNTGRVTVEITGADFTPQTQAHLVSGNSVIDAAAMDFVSPIDVFATFDLTGQTVGAYDVRLTDASQIATDLGAFQVVAGQAANVQISLIVPSFLHAGGQGVIAVDYVNAGNTDVVAPLLTIASDKAALRVPQESVFSSAGVAFLAVAPDGPAGVLRPGQSGRQILFAQSLSTIPHDQIHFSLGTMADPAQTIDWASVKDVSRPASVPADAWDAIWSNFTAEVGSTAGQFQQTLADGATYLARVGSATSDVRQLTALAFQAADDLLPAATLTSNVDLAIPGPNLDLSFGRALAQDLAGRYRLGPLGRGWAHNWEIAIQADANGNVILQKAGGFRSFVKQRDGSYQGAPGDAATLTLNSGVYNLREVNGYLFVFRTDGKLDYVTDPHGNRITAQYDGSGQLTSLIHSDGDSLNFAYNAQGRLVQAADSTGRVVVYGYDASGEHLTSVTTVQGTTQYSYLAGQTPQREHALASITYSDGTHEFFQYDNVGRLISQARDGNAEALNYTYSGLAEMTVTDANGSTTILFSDQEQPEVVRDALGRVTQFSYDANRNLVETITPAGTRYRYTYDAAGNQTSVTNPLGQQVRLSYDATFSSLTSLTDPSGNVTSYNYDAQDNLRSIVYPGGTQEQFSYDPLGNLTEAINRRGHAVAYSRDSRGLITEETFADGSTVSFTYDARDNLIAAVDAQGTIAMTYDGADRLTKITYPGGRFLQFTYDAGGRRTQSVDQGGFTVNYQYDAVGRLAGLTDGAGAPIVAYTYDGAGRLVRKDLGNGTFTTYTYDAADQLLSLVNHAPDGSVNSEFDYTYDLLGRRTSVTTADGTTEYVYDAIGQLVRVGLPNGRVIQYAYDANGNRTSVTDNGVTAAYSSNSLNEVLSAGGTTYTYDADGNLASSTDSSGTTTYTYDDLNRLVAQSGPGGTFQYVYDPLGHRAAAIHDGVRTDFLFDPIGVTALVSEYDGTGASVTHYTYGQGLVSRVAPGGTAYYDFDGTGSTAGLTDAGGIYVNRYSYLPFGETTTLAAAVANPFQFAGQLGVADNGSGLLFMRSRYYATAIGQFVSDDPLGVLGGDVNSRRYVDNAPVDFVDPLGRTKNPITPEEMDSAKSLDEFKPQLDNEGNSFAENRSPLGNDPNVDNPLHPGPQPETITPKTEPPPVAGGKPSPVDPGPPPSAGSKAGTAGRFIPGLGRVARFLGPGLVFLGKIAPWLDFGYRSYSILTDPNSPYRVIKINPSGGGDSTNAVGGDPNDIVGPAGFGPQNFVVPDQTFPYQIDFENDPTIANAPALDVVVTAQLDPNLDWTTFQLGSFGFGSMVVNVPAGLSAYQTQVDYHNQDGSPLRVDVSAGLDLQTGVLTWAFRSVDPVTGTFPTDPFAGFLPVDDATNRGKGFVTYTVQPKPALATGTQVNATASVVFDINAPVVTNTFTNTIDADPPTAALADPQPGATVYDSTLNARGYLDVSFSDATGSGPDPATILDAQPEFTLSGSGAAGVSVNGAPTLVLGTTSTYRYQFTGAFTTGAVSLSFPAGSFADNVGNLNQASTQPQSFNVILQPSLGPMVTINQSASQADPTHAGTIHFTVVFSARVTGFDVGDVTLTGTAAKKHVSAIKPVGKDGRTFDVRVVASGSGTVIASIPANVVRDLSGNGNTASTSDDNSVTVRAAQSNVGLFDQSSAMMAAEGAMPSGSATALQSSDLGPIVEEAVARWNVAGTRRVLANHGIEVILADLPGAMLGKVEAGRIFLDRDAAGHGWFIDPTPGIDEEFESLGKAGALRSVDPRAVDRIDLLTVVEHELGHLLGLDDEGAMSDSLMSGWLAKGVRRSPSLPVDAVLAN